MGRCTIVRNKFYATPINVKARNAAMEKDGGKDKALQSLISKISKCIYI